MRKISLILAVASLFTLISCSSAKIHPKTDEGILIFYVEDFNKPVNKPVIRLQVDGIEKPLELKLDAPAAVVHMAPAESYHASAWVEEKEITINGLDNFDFMAPAGMVTLAPVKIQLISKSQIEVKNLSRLDLEYAMDQFAKNPKLGDLKINFPELHMETGTDS